MPGSEIEPQPAECQADVLNSRPLHYRVSLSTIPRLSRWMILCEGIIIEKVDR